MKYLAFRGARPIRTTCFLLLLCVCLVSSSFAAELPETLVPLGVTAGIRLPEDGVTVSALTGVATDAGDVWPARDAGLRPGDRLLAVDGAPVASPADLQRASEGGKPVELTVRRGSETVTLTVTPVQGRDGYRIGVWIRDSMLGIGTLTYYDPSDGSFGALGHGITAEHSEELLSIGGSRLVSSFVTDVRPGRPGEPGELHGRFDSAQTFGSVRANTPGGIFGVMHAPPLSARPVPVSPASAVHSGDAEILACPDGESPALYRVRILKLYPGDENLRNLLIEVTDDALLAKTGGIIQGMSGSPILQDGRLIGAVTHVLVNDPARGYGIFIENMLAQAG